MTGARPRRRVALALWLAILAVPLGGLAYAYWGGNGSGAGSGSADLTADVVLSPGTPTANLYPGGSADVVLSVANPNASAVHIGSLALDPGQGTGGYGVDGGHSGCAVATFTFTTATNGGGGWSVPAKVGAVNGTLSVTLTSALAMSAGAANACQGATVTVYLVAGP